MFFQMTIYVKPRSPTRKGMNLWLPSPGSSPGGTIEQCMRNNKWPKKLIHNCVYMFWTLEKVFVCCLKLHNICMSHNTYATYICPLRSISRLPIYVG